MYFLKIILSVLVIISPTEIFARPAGDKGLRVKIPGAVVGFMNSQGEKIGTATLKEVPQGVSILLEVSSLPPGEHGIHFHEMGLCNPPHFKAAGAHFNIENKEHGLKNPKGPHTGDLPNLNVKADGTVLTTMISPAVTLNKGKNALFKSGGTALVIHSNADDHLTDPSGNSGDRIACGVIQPDLETTK